jgi:hypothetical protein
MRKTNRKVWGALALCFLGACAGDGTSPDEAMTDVEVSALIGVISDAKGALDGQSLGADGSLAVAVPCSFIGDIAISGKQTHNADFTQIDDDFIYAFRKCRQGSDAGVFVLNGSVHEITQQKLIVADSTATVVLKLTGSLKWEIAKRSGTCDVNYNYDYKFVAKTGAETEVLTGSMCGVDLAS